MKKKQILYLAQAAMIAALYMVLTLLANSLGLASQSIQLRFSEALTILPFFTSAAIPGLFVGCLLSNFLISGGVFMDIIFGSLATLLGAYGTYLLRHRSRYLACVPPIVANGLIVPFIITYVYQVNPLWFNFLTVTAGEILSCGVLGTLLLITLDRYKKIIFPPLS